MTVVTMLVPWRPDGAHRDAAWAWLRHRWSTAHPDWQVVEAACPPGPWSKGAAVLAALPSVPNGVVVLADADSWTDGIPTAVDRVVSGWAAWAVPHRLIRRLTPEATAQAITTGDLDGHLSERPYLGHPGGGVTVLTRDLLAEAPLDPRFHGWGQEDDAWALALTTLAGRPWRGVTDLHHLWHPSQPRASRTRGSDRSWALYLRYCRARGRPDLMRSLLAEVAACRSSPASTAAR